MKSLLIYVLTLFLSGAAIAMFNSSAFYRPGARKNLESANNAAFRDGLFLGRLDAARGRKPHLTSGRWAGEVDRRSFVAGYLQGYHEARGADTSPQLNFAELVERRGYDDGFADGLRQRLASGPFRAFGTEHFLRPDPAYFNTADNLERYQQSYRDAYCTGYQQAYYSEAGMNKSATYVDLSGAPVQ